MRDGLGQQKGKKFKLGCTDKYDNVLSNTLNVQFTSRMTKFALGLTEFLIIGIYYIVTYWFNIQECAM